MNTYAIPSEKPKTSEVLSNNPKISLQNMASISYKAVSKAIIRLMDISFSILGLLFLLPALFVVALLVKSYDNGPILYKQTRIGLNGKTFGCYKFRSMRTDSAERLAQILATSPEAKAEWDRDHKFKNDPRITPIGRFIRKTSLDEFPQLWNVIKGEMSLIGPRPIVACEVKKYAKSFRYYTSTKPGISGMWQVSGRNETTYSRRVALDRLYAKKYGVLIYLYILVATIPAVLFQKGSY
jgi:lipopolysaccharide/colanic/teichoic acid biosynthesis glycosyltransferase